MIVARESLVVEKRNNVRLLRMRFGRGNALTPDVIAAVTTELDRESVPTVLTGDGDIFCAGLDLVAIDAFDRSEMRAFMDRFAAMMLQLATAPFPLVAAINGHAVAGGCALAMCCDHRVGRSGAFKLGINEQALGVVLPAVVIEVMRGALAPPALRRVILTGSFFGPEDALRLGLVDELAAGAEATVDRACEFVAAMDLTVSEYARTKGSLFAPVAERFRVTREALDQRFLNSWFSSRSKELRAARVADLEGKR